MPPPGIEPAAAGSLSLITFDADSGQRVEHPLVLDAANGLCQVELSPAPGSSDVVVLLRDERGICLHAEVQSRGYTAVPVVIERGADGAPRLKSEGRRVLILPTDAAAAAPRRSPVAARSSPRLDLAIVVDGTARAHQDAGRGQSQAPVALDGTATPRLLLDDATSWRAEVEKLVAFVEALAGGHQEPRVSLLAFGDSFDDDLAGSVGATDLRPRYMLEPRVEDRRLRPMTAAELGAQLRGVKATSGADFVDALADALLACTRLPWRSEARRMVLVAGDSPGYSLLYPAPASADAQLRSVDLETAALALHESDVELVTLYFDRWRGGNRESFPYVQQLLGHTRDQYHRLAARPELAFTLSDFDPVLAAACCKPAPFLGRGACLPLAARFIGRAQ